MVNDTGNTSDTPGQQGQSSEENKQETLLPFHNPLDPNDDRKISKEDLENEEKYKEALTERD